MKFLRDYSITIQSPTGDRITISSPFSVKINIVRNTLASANTAKITLTNLGRNTRNRLYKDRYQVADYWEIVIFAGYGNNLKKIFQGNIHECKSSKKGTEYETVIDCFDGGHAIQNSYTNVTYRKKTGFREMFTGVIRDMAGLAQGTIGSLGDQTLEDRGRTLVGQSSSILGDLTDNNYFIDNEGVYVLSEDEYAIGQVLLLSSEQLLNTPERRDTFLNCKVLFLPEARLGLLCEVKSTEAIYNGQYKTEGFTHDITISGSQGGTAITNMQLYAGANGLKGVI